MLPLYSSEERTSFLVAVAIFAHWCFFLLFIVVYKSMIIYLLLLTSMIGHHWLSIYCLLLVTQLLPFLLVIAPPGCDKRPRFQGKLLCLNWHSMFSSG